MTSHEPTIAELTAKAKVLDRLVAHLDKRKDVQNIDLMILAGFCRNCLSKWYLAEANENESAREENIEEGFFLITQDVVNGEDEQYTILGKVQLLLFYEYKLNAKLNSNPRGGNWV